MIPCEIFRLLMDEIHRRDSIVGSNTYFDKLFFDLRFK